MTWIQTYSGRKFWPLDPRPEDVDVVDIAHALSLKCRFTGHCRVFYSVAEHSVRVARAFQDLPAARSHGPVGVLCALLHDAAEAYLPDVARPVKNRFRMLVCAEQCLTDVIYGRFRLPLPERTGELWRAIEAADDSLLLTEARDLMGPSPEPWLVKAKLLPEAVVPWEIEVAEREFLGEFWKWEGLR